MRRRPPSSVVALAVVLVAVAACTGCGGGEDDASIEQRLDEKGTLDVVEQAAQAEYEPPADGMLTDEQMEMYVAVQARAAKIREVAQKRLEERGNEDAEGKKRVGFSDAMKALADAGDVLTAELRAAQELGENPAEFRWVQTTLAEARLAAFGEQAKEATARFGEQAVANLEEQLEKTADGERKAEIQKQIDDLKASLAAGQDESRSDAARHNHEMFVKYEERIAAAEKQAGEST